MYMTCAVNKCSPPSRTSPDKFPEGSEGYERKSLPRELRTLSKREMRDENSYSNCASTPNEPVEFWVSCRLWIDQVELVTMSVGGSLQTAHIFLDGLMPGPDDPFFQYELGLRLLMVHALRVFVRSGWFFLVCAK